MICLEKQQSSQVLPSVDGAQESPESLAVGVKRISWAKRIYRTALGAFLPATREMREHGKFTFAKSAVSPREVSLIFE